jgi:peptidoglycan lytic transglycosylase
VTSLADRYTGRHVRAARHGAWITKQRSRVRPGAQLLPAAAAVTVAGLLVGGAGTAINVNAMASSGPIADNPTDASAGLQAQAVAARAATADRVSRATPRPTQSPTSTRVIDTGTCDASYYEDPQPTADGEMFNPAALTAAHPSLPFNSRVRVTNLANGRSVVVRINDRGPFVEDRCLDLSRAAFAAIANPSSGVVDVRYEVLVQEAT